MVILSRKMYTANMDERRRTIRELDEKRRENLLFRARTLEDLGRSLTERLGETALPGSHGESYRRYRREISDSEASIESIQDALKRIRELDEEISIKRIEKADRQEEADRLYSRLGEFVLDGDFARPCPAELQSLRRQQDLFTDRALSLNERLSDLTMPGEKKLFPWLGRLIQSMVIRSALKRTERQLEKIRCQGGEIYARGMEHQSGTETGKGKPGKTGEASPPEEEDAFSILLRDTRAKRQDLLELDEAIAVLVREKEKINASFHFTEKPARRIKILKERTEKRRKDLQDLYLRLGEAAGSDTALGECMEDGDRQILEKAQSYGRSAEENSREIESIEKAIALDNEREKIARLEKAVSGERSRAANSERNIAELNRKIAEAQKRIGELSAK
jgi:hypothetical protein